MAWHRFDFRALVREVNLRLIGAAAAGSGFVAVGAITSTADLNAWPSRGVVFTSADGRTC